MYTGCRRKWTIIFPLKYQEIRGRGRPKKNGKIVYTLYILYIREKGGTEPRLLTSNVDPALAVCIQT